jgi:hypothetical protein
MHVRRLALYEERISGRAAVERAAPSSVRAVILTSAVVLLVGRRRHHLEGVRVGAVVVLVGWKWKEEGFVYWLGWRED